MDINECYENTHSCHPSAKCVNTEGHFECVCDKEPAASDPKAMIAVEKKCKLSCMFENDEIPDQGKVSPRNQPCKVCTCSSGVITCVEPPCNCSAWQGRNSGRDLCCPQCDPKESCQHQELKHVSFRSGEQWIYQCQTCECLVGFRGHLESDSVANCVPSILSILVWRIRLLETRVSTAVVRESVTFSSGRLLPPMPRGLMWPRQFNERHRKAMFL